MVLLVRAVVVAVAAWCVVTSVTALMCQFPHCELVECEPVSKNNCSGEVRMGGGYCGCCMACFTTLEFEESCGRKDALDAILYPPTALCNTGLYCDYNSSTCQQIPMWNIG